jgi:hypothetical protein
MNDVLQTPVAFFIFRRPDTTRLVFDAIAKARPERLFVVADGPRHANEEALCAATRTIIQTVDWDCEVLTNYADTNLGLKRRISSGLDWVFEQVEQAIILEDDCLPDPAFFPFCTELLEKYRDDARVMHISGDNFLPDHFAHQASYFFSRYAYVWGWATWRRAWQKFDGELTLWKDAAVRARVLDQFASPQERQFWTTVWQQTSAGQINTWDYPWAFTCRALGGWAVVPSVNLVSNIGFGPTATHTPLESGFGFVPRGSLAFPLIHPPTVAPDSAADAALGRLVLVRPPLRKRIVHRLRRMFSIS